MAARGIALSPRAALAALALPPLLFLGLVLLAPTLRLAAEAVAGQEAFALLAQVLRDPYLRWRIGWSLAQAAATGVLALVLGVPLAWVLARFDFPGRRLALRLLMLPFVVPTLVAAGGVLALWGPHGWLGGWIGAQFGWALRDTPWLLLYGNLFFNLCLVVRAGVNGLAQVSATRVAAARTLGATPWRVFLRVEWPALTPWLASASCLVFLYCFSGFGLALVLGGQRYATVEVEIYTLVAHELQLGPAAALALVTLLLTGAVALVHAALERRLATPARPDPIAPRPPRGLAGWALLAACMAVLLLVCVAPLLAILAQALAAGPATWIEVLADEQTRLAAWNTLRFTGCALVGATGLGLLHAVAARRYVLLRAATFLPFVVSPVAVAFGLLLLYPGWTASSALLMAAYVLLAWPFVANAVSAGLDSQPPQLAQAARSLGATPVRAWWRVTLPLLAGPLRRGMAFAAATALGEFAVTLFLSRPEWVTLTTLMHERLGRPGALNRDAAMVLASLLMLLSLGVFLLIEGGLRAPAGLRARASSRRDAAPTGVLHA